MGGDEEQPSSVDRILSTLQQHLIVQQHYLTRRLWDEFNNHERKERATVGSKDQKLEAWKEMKSSVLKEIFAHIYSYALLLSLCVVSLALTTKQIEEL